MSSAVRRPPYSVTARYPHSFPPTTIDVTRNRWSIPAAGRGPMMTWRLGFKAASASATAGMRRGTSSNTFGTGASPLAGLPAASRRYSASWIAHGLPVRSDTAFAMSANVAPSSASRVRRSSIALLCRRISFCRAMVMRLARSSLERCPCMIAIPARCAKLTASDCCSGSKGCTASSSSRKRMPMTSSRTIIGTPSMHRTPQSRIAERTGRLSPCALRMRTGRLVARISRVKPSAAVPHTSLFTRSSSCVCLVSATCPQ